MHASLLLKCTQSCQVSVCIYRFCTSILAQDKLGNLYHGRNLDYPHPALRNLTVNLIFRKDGKVEQKSKVIEQAAHK